MFSKESRESMLESLCKQVVKDRDRICFATIACDQRQRTLQENSSRFNAVSIERPPQCGYVFRYPISCRYTHVTTHMEAG